MTPLSFLSIFLLGAVILLSVRLAPAGMWGKPLMSCFTIVIGLFGIYYLMPGAMLLALTGSRYVWLPNYSGSQSVAVTGFVATFALLMFLGGYVLRSRGTPREPTLSVPLSPDPMAVLLAWGMVMVGIGLKLYVISESGGLEMTILRQSGGVRESLRLDQINPTLTRLWFISSLADAGITWLVIRRMQLKRSFWPFVVLFVMVTALSFVGTGKRLYALWPIVALALGFHFYVRPLRISLLPVGALVGLALGFASLLFRIYAPASLANVQIDLYRVPWAEGSILRFYFMSLEFASFELLTLAIEDSETIVRQFGGAWQAFVTTNIEPLAYFVPRSIWPSKPEIFLDLSHANRVIMFGGSLDNSFGVASMLPGTSWTLGGPLGLSVAMGLLGWLSATFDNMRGIRGVPTPLGVLAYAFVVMTVFHLFRQGTLAWTALLVLIQHLGLIVGFILLFVVDSGRNRARARQRGRTVLVDANLPPGTAGEGH
jgi:hypothetical protein